MLTRSQTIAITAVLAALAPSFARAETRVTVDQWYTLLLNDQPSGWVHAWVTEEGDELTSHSEMRLVFARAGRRLEAKVSESFRETRDGRAIAARSSQQWGRLAVERVMTFEGGAAKVTTKQAGVEQTHDLGPPPAAGHAAGHADHADATRWVTPLAAERLFVEKLASGVGTYQYTTVSPDFGWKTITRQIHGRTTVEALGREAPAIHVEETVSSTPGLRVGQYLDEQGRLLRSAVQIGGVMKVDIVASDKALALQQIVPAEAMRATLIQAEGEAVDHPGKVERAVYELTLRKQQDVAGDHAAGDHADDQAIEQLRSLPTIGGQRVRVDEDRAIVIVSVDTRRSPTTAQPDEAYLAASATLNHRDPRVGELLGEALADLPPDQWRTATAAEKLRRFVYRYVRAKDLSVGFATASEVARTGRGDCTEHAVLLAALLRAAGVPSRTVRGLTYAPRFAGMKRVFVFHMWTQAWLADSDASGGLGRWIDLDATTSHPFDAMHITLGVSAEGPDPADGNMLVQMGALLGRLRVHVTQQERPNEQQIGH